MPPKIPEAQKLTILYPLFIELLLKPRIAGPPAGYGRFIGNKKSGFRNAEPAQAG
jgi:hypothetical protein